MQSQAMRQLRKNHLTGCGMHVDEVMADVPTSQQCTCATRSNS